MNKQKLILLGIVILLAGLTGGWLLASCSINTKLSQSEAARIQGSVPERSDKPLQTGPALEYPRSKTVMPNNERQK